MGHRPLFQALRAVDLLSGHAFLQRKQETQGCFLDQKMGG